MMLALDLGNSALKAACFGGNEAVDTARFATSDPHWRDAFSAWLSRLGNVEAAGLSSVVPGLTAQLTAQVTAAGMPEPVVIHPSLPLPLRVAYATPQTLGVDRLAAAVAAWTRFGPHRPVVALDAGTALTYEVVTTAGAYVGGAIAPGPTLLVASLNRGTAQLPPVPFDAPPSPIGDSTHTALQSGLVYGFLDGVEGMLRRIRAVLGNEAFVVATGGWADWLAQHIEGIDAVRPLLVLEGVRDIVRYQSGS